MVAREDKGLFGFSCQSLSQPCGRQLPLHKGAFGAGQHKGCGGGTAGGYYPPLRGLRKVSIEFVGAGDSARPSTFSSLFIVSSKKIYIFSRFFQLYFRFWAYNEGET